MLAMLILCVMVGVLTFYQVFKQGLFSALIMAVLSVISSLAAFNYYELLARWVQKIGLESIGGQAISLVGLFVVCLLILRELSDRLIKGNMNFSLLIDRAGSAVFGLITALVIAGMVALGFQMLPIEAKILGYDRFTNLGNLQDHGNLFPHADGLVVGLVSQVSKYGFSGRNNFRRYHPDFLEELYMNRLVLDPASRRDATQDAITLDAAWLINGGIMDYLSSEPLSPGVGEQFVAVRLRIKAGAEKDKGARDVDGNIRFVLGNVRLAGFNNQEPGAQGYSIYPLGILKPGWRMVDRIGLNDGRVFTTATPVVDLLFACPGDMKRLAPQYIEFKRSARYAMPSAKQLTEAKPDRAKIFEASRVASEAELRRPAGSSISYECKSITVLTKAEQPLNTMNVPAEEILKEAKEKQKLTELEGLRRISERFQSGHVLLQIEGKGRSEKIKELSVPQGYFLVLLQVDSSKDPIKGTLILPSLVDIDHREYYPVGFGAEGKWQGQEAMEFAYNSEEGKINKKELVPKVALLEKDGHISKMTCYYLFKAGEQAAGLIGCLVRQPGKDKSELWPLAGEIDAVLVGAKDK